MAKAKKNETQAPECPFGNGAAEEAKSVFLENPSWRRIYGSAPEGAKHRLEVCFWFSQNKPTRDEGSLEMLERYRSWREDVERAMSEEDILYMYKLIDNPAAKEHYAALLKKFRSGSQADCGVKLMSYDEFFAMLEEQGEFKVYDYDDEIKAMILGDFLPVLKGSGDPLETHIEDILATAKLMEVRIYPKEEWLYVRVEVKFLAETAKWSRPYQMLAAWDCFNELKGYVFPVGKGRRSELPIELENPENAAQREMRSLLRSERIAAAGKEGRQ